MHQQAYRCHIDYGIHHAYLMEMYLTYIHAVCFALCSSDHLVHFQNVASDITVNASKTFDDVFYI